MIHPFSPGDRVVVEYSHPPKPAYRRRPIATGTVISCFDTEKGFKCDVRMDRPTKPKWENVPVARISHMGAVERIAELAKSGGASTRPR